MQSYTQIASLRHTAGLGVLAGLAGAGAEIAWIMLYAAFSGADAADVARGVALAASGGALDSALAGIVVHMLVAAALGLALAAAWRFIPARLGAASQFGLALLVFAAVWKIDFFVVLPLISPAFVELLPYGVTLASKLLFGFAAAIVLRQGGALTRRFS